MQFLASISAFALLALVNARECTIEGSEGRDIGFTGQPVASFSVTGGLTVNCVGEEGDISWGTDKIPNSQTIKAEDTGLPEDIQWVFDKIPSGGIERCAAGYRGGPLVEGVVSDEDIDIAVGAGSRTSSSCKVVIQTN